MQDNNVTFSLDSYNEMQREAILDFEHNLMILACAGSGKTRTITGKMAYAISKGLVQPYEICAVTFTNKAAGEMRERLEALVPEAGGRATVRTFHSLGVLLLRRFGDRIGLPKGFAIADDSDAAHFVKTALELKGKAAARLARITAGWILDAKEHGCGPEDEKAEAYFHIGDVQYGNKADQMSVQEIFKAYEAEKEKASALDFPDLISYAVKLVETCDDVRNWCHRHYRMVLVDEYQDSNIMQARFLKSFVAPTAQLVVVGDDDQSIYSFRGAVVDNILDFPKEFDNVREIRLEKNYRSTGEILSVAGAVIKNNGKRYAKEIVSALNSHGVKPVLKESRNAYSEAVFVADRIAALQGKGESCAVLYRQHRCAMALKKVLLEKRIPFKVAGGVGVLGSKVVKDAMALMRLCMLPSDSASLHRIIASARIGLGEEAYRRLVEENPDVFVSLAALSVKGRYAKGYAILLRCLTDLSERLLGSAPALPAHLVSAGTTPPADGEALSQLELFSGDGSGSETERDVVYMTDGELLVDVMGRLGIVNEPDAEEDDGSGVGEDNPLEVYSAMLERRRIMFDPDMAEGYEGGEPTPLQVLQSFVCRSELGDDAGREDEDVPVLSTMHASKGLEWDNVFVIGLEDEIIPGRANDMAEEEEERRIFYVAMTRGRKRLWLCTKREAMTGRFGMQVCRPCRFLKEIPQDFISEEPVLSSPVKMNSFADFKRADEISDAERIEKGDKVSYHGKWSGTVVAQEEYMGRRVLSVKTDSGGLVKVIDGMGHLVKIPRAEG